MPARSTSTTLRQSALIKRISAMSAEVFNAAVAAYDDDQNDLNTWET
jgi:hypothetical protein